MPSISACSNIHIHKELSWDYIGFIIGVYWVYIRVILGLY